MKIYFVTSNTYKAAEIAAYFKEAAKQPGFNIELCIIKTSVQEILHEDIEVIVKRKALEAYASFGGPCVVEHGGVFMDALPGLPGGIGQIVWNAVGDRICSFLNEHDSRGAAARSIIGYCDGKRVRTYTGETRGQITTAARGEYKFNWDPIFIPDGSDLTYGEMGAEKKRATSQSLKAWKAFLKAEFNADMP
ncbi:MAG: non-canonical purine NTP pyrophosphatase [Chitinophagaceae bacterium]